MIANLCLSQALEGGPSTQMHWQASHLCASLSIIYTYTPHHPRVLTIIYDSTELCTTTSHLVKDSLNVGSLS